MQHTRRAIAQARRRRRVGKALHALGWAWLSAAVLVIGTSLTASAVGVVVPWWVYAALLGVTGALAVVGAWMRPDSDQALAVLLDEELELKDALGSALFASQQPDHPFAQGVIDEAELAARQAPVRDAVPIGVPDIWRWTLAVSAVALVVVVFLPGAFDPFGAKEDQRQTQAEIEAELAAQESIEEALALIEPERPDGDEDASQDSEDLMDRLEAVLSKRDLRSPEAKRDAEAELSQLRDELSELTEAQKAQDQAMQQSLSGLETSDRGPADRFVDALRRGDYDNARQQLESIAKQADEEKLSDKQKDQLQQQLEQLAEQLEQQAQQQQAAADEAKKEIQEKLEDAGVAKSQAQQAAEQSAKQGTTAQQAQQQMQNAGASPEQAKDLTQQTQQARQDAQQNQSNGDASSNLSKALQKMAQAVKNGQPASQPAQSGQQQLGQMSQQQQQSQQTQQAQQKLQEAQQQLAHGDQQQQPGQGQQPQQNAQGQQGQQSASGQQPPNGQQSQSSQQQAGTQPGSQPGQQPGSQPGAQPGSAQANGGNTPSNSGSTGSTQTASAQGQPGGVAGGRGDGGNPLGANERSGAGYGSTAVVDANDARDGKVISSWQTGGEVISGEAQVQFQNAVTEAQAAAERAVTDDRAPRRYHRAIERYFNRLPATTTQPTATTPAEAPAE